MKILLDARPHRYRFSGTGRYALELAAALGALFRETGDELCVVASPANSEELAARGVESIRESAVEPESPDSREVIHKIAADAKPDIYHTTNAVCPPLATIPSVLTLHDCIPLRCAFESTPQERVAFAAQIADALKICSRAIAVSETTFEDAREYFPAQFGKIRVVRHGVSDAFKPTSAAEHERAVEHLGLRRPYILYLGNSLRHKNLVALFDGYAHAAPLLHGVRLALGGYGCEQAPRHSAAIAKHGLEDLAVWIGRIPADDITAVFGAASAFVMPSLYEGFSMPLTEAMACGVPVACSDIPVFREICGDAAAYFDHKNPESIAQGLITAATDNIARNRLRAAGLDRARLFNWHDTAAKTLEVYKEAFADK